MKTLIPYLIATVVFATISIGIYGIFKPITKQVLTVEYNGKQIEVINGTDSKVSVGDSVSVNIDDSETTGKGQYRVIAINGL